MKKDNFRNKLLFLVGILMPCQIIAFKIIPLFVIPFLLLVFLKTLLSVKIIVRMYGIYIVCLTIVSGIWMYLGPLPTGWKESSTNQIVLFLTVSMVLFLKFCESEIIELVRGIRIGLLLNIIWGFIQFALFSLARFDINDFLFNKILLIRENASTFNTSLNTMCITGLNWHPAQLVPVIVLSYFLFDNILIKCFLFFLAFISTSTTCIVAITLCFVVDLIKSWKKLRCVRAKDFFVVMILTSIVLLIFVLKVNIISYFINHVMRVINRINSAFTNININNSTMLHLRYYTAYPLILSKYSLMDALFGVGFECSGYPFTELFGQYASLKSWHVESDLINFLVGRGIIWSISHYVLLCVIFIKGRRISPKYAMMILVLICCGILYNNNFLWVEFLIYIIFIAISNNHNIFCSNIKNMF